MIYWVPAFAGMTDLRGNDCHPCESGDPEKEMWVPVVCTGTCLRGNDCHPRENGDPEGLGKLRGKKIK